MIFLSSPAVHTFFLTAFRKASCTRGLKIPIVNLHPVRRPATEVSAHFPYRRPCVLNTNVLVVGSERKKKRERETIIENASVCEFLSRDARVRSSSHIAGDYRHPRGRARERAWRGRAFPAPIRIKY